MSKIMLPWKCWFFFVNIIFFFFFFTDMVWDMPKKSRVWPQDDLVAAYYAVIEDGMPVNAAAKHYDVPRITLTDWVKGKFPVHMAYGRKTALSEEDENALVRSIDYVMYVFQHLFPFTQAQVIIDMTSGVKSTHVIRNLENNPLWKWYCRFHKYVMWEGGGLCHVECVHKMSQGTKLSYFSSVLCQRGQTHSPILFSARVIPHWGGFKTKVHSAMATCFMPHGIIWKKTKKTVEGAETSSPPMLNLWYPLWSQDLFQDGNKPLPAPVLMSKWDSHVNPWERKKKTDKRSSMES